MKVNWGAVLVGQLEFYWAAHLRPRLDGLTDAEYFWEPVEGCWTLRRDRTAPTPSTCNGPSRRHRR